MLVVIAALAGVAIGEDLISPAAVWHALGQVAAGHPNASHEASIVAARLPRVCLGLTVGAGLAVAGVVMQALTRNPLGDPSILGVNAGAAAAVVIAGLMGVSSVAAAPIVAIPGALAAAVIVFVLGGATRSSTGSARLVLAGAVVSAVLVALTQTATLLNPNVFNDMRFWQVGSISGRNWDSAIAAFVPTAIFLVIAMVLGPSLNVLALGDEAAIALGAKVGVVRVVGLLTVTVLCAAATAQTGPTGFVGLAVPHLLRSLVGEDQRWLVPLAAPAGAALVVLADALGRLVAQPSSIDVGIVTALVGAPFLLVAVRRSRGIA